MTEPRLIPDRVQRERALEPGRSFIVQAPAGSGKTELLIQRFLVLLARVERPEEIAAITFTKKAAAEMRKRIFEALATARCTSRPSQSHKAKTWDLAKAALERNDALGWKLEENAARLRVQTIDALCASLTRQMPVLAKFGAQPESVEDAAVLYLEAARNTLAILEDASDPMAADVARLFAHLDNNTDQAQELLATMLRQRDHWIRKIHGADNRTALEAALAAVRVEAVRRVGSLLPATLAAPASDDDAEAWIAFAKQLLTKDGKWRKRHPLYDELCENDPLCAGLSRLQSLPSGRYTDDQWEALGAIMRLLPRAVAELRVVFAAHGQADFVEIAQGALRALESDEGPTDLMLSLDYLMRHILVDEFQDTSFTQFELLEKLTAGWEKGDERTLFVVGDPMQSIYRFREAEVGLFLRAQHSGIGPVALEPLTLTANFRSQEGVVAWVNEAFAKVMPAKEDIAAGAVTYSRSDAVHDPQPVAVTVHPFFDGDSAGEAFKVAELAKAALEAPGLDPEKPSTVAILVRNRKHLTEIVPQLKTVGLAFRAIEIEPLGHRPVVQDLFALTRALAHLADRTPWLAVLRAPWCGLTLADLHALCAPSAMDIPEEGSHRLLLLTSGRTLWEAITDTAHVSKLSGDGQQRLTRIREVLEHCFAQRRRSSLRECVEGAWLALGGPACVENATDLEDAEIYLDYLEESQAAGAIADFDAFEEGVSTLYALPDLSASERLQVMTIHKAKGLEFDTVIVPGLGAGTGRDDRKLFLWMERATDLLLAPTNPTGSDKDPIYEYIRLLDKEKSDHENGRLLYVATTRAKKALHLLGCTKVDEEGEPKLPPKGALLSKLWPAVGSSFGRGAMASRVPETEGSWTESSGKGVDQGLRRLPVDWSLPAFPPSVHWTSAKENERIGEEIEFSWVGETARHIGNVVHRWLQRIAEDEMQGWDRTRLERMHQTFRDELARRGISETELDATATRVVTALINSLQDARGRWLLGPQREAQNEFRLTASIAGKLRNLVIDRTFVDPEGGRWIVDYKTSSHEGADIEGFLDQERERYRQQLERYAVALTMERSSLGLYFPLLSGWREWQT